MFENRFKLGYKFKRNVDGIEFRGCYLGVKIWAINGFVCFCDGYFDPKKRRFLKALYDFCGLSLTCNFYRKAYCQNMFLSCEDVVDGDYVLRWLFEDDLRAMRFGSLLLAYVSLGVVRKDIESTCVRVWSDARYSFLDKLDRRLPERCLTDDMINSLVEGIVFNWKFLYKSGLRQLRYKKRLRDLREKYSGLRRGLDDNLAFVSDAGQDRVENEMSRLTRQYDLIRDNMVREWHESFLCKDDVVLNKSRFSNLITLFEGLPYLPVMVGVLDWFCKDDYNGTVLLRLFPFMDTRGSVNYVYTYFVEFCNGIALKVGLNSKVPVAGVIEKFSGDKPDIFDRDDEFSVLCFSFSSEFDFVHVGYLNQDCEFVTEGVPFVSEGYVISFLNGRFHFANVDGISPVFLHNKDK